LVAAAESNEAPLRRLGSGTLIGDRYRIDGRVARGGMSTLWAAWDLELARPVALKFVDTYGNEGVDAEELVRRFQREARAIARLRTPHVVQIHDNGESEHGPYYVMELLDGEDLHRRLQRVGKLSLREAAVIARQAARGLRHAHAAGIVHRDLKPHNVFLARAYDEEIVKLVDFGIAKMGEARGEDATAAGQLLGSPRYMSPEQARGHRDVDHRSDLWSLAAILFRAVTGRVAFPGSEPGDIIIRICSEAPPVPSRLAPELPAALDAFFGRAFARDRDERFQSAAELAEAFTRAVESPCAVTTPRATAVGSKPEEPRVLPERPSTEKPADELEVTGGTSARSWSALALAVSLTALAITSYVLFEQRAGRAGLTAVPMLSAAPVLTAALATSASVATAEPAGPSPPPSTRNATPIRAERALEPMPSATSLPVPPTGPAAPRGWGSATAKPPTAPALAIPPADKAIAPEVDGFEPDDI
jgi:serine/threonine-protein kinase